MASLDLPRPGSPTIARTRVSPRARTVAASSSSRRSTPSRPTNADRLTRSGAEPARMRPRLPRTFEPVQPCPWRRHLPWPIPDSRRRQLARRITDEDMARFGDLGKPRRYVDGIADHGEARLLAGAATMTSPALMPICRPGKWKRSSRAASRSAYARQREAGPYRATQDRPRGRRARRRGHKTVAHYLWHGSAMKSSTISRSSVIHGLTAPNTSSGSRLSASDV